MASLDDAKDDDDGSDPESRSTRAAMQGAGNATHLKHIDRDSNDDVPAVIGNDRVARPPIAVAFFASSAPHGGGSDRLKLSSQGKTVSRKDTNGCDTCNSQRANFSFNTLTHCSR